MDDAARLNQLRHDVANPLSALLAEVQLLLLDESRLAPEVSASLRLIEEQAFRIRVLLHDT